MADREERKLEKAGEKTGIGKFQFASLEKNKTLGAFQTTQSQSKDL